MAPFHRRRLLPSLLLATTADALLWFPDVPNNLGDLDGLVDVDGTFYMRYNNGACTLGGTTDPRCATGPGGHCDPGITSFASATSVDGVHWVDHGAMMYAFDENATCPRTGSGSGSVWRAADNQTWMINYSGETIRMMKAPRPNGPWTGIGSNNRTGGWGPNAVPNMPADGKQWYAGGRWDTMNTWPAPTSDNSSNTMYGWITVMGGKLTRDTITGFAASKDGIAWQAQPPAKSLFVPNHSFKGSSLEQCGCAWGGDTNPRWYCLNGFRGTWGIMDGSYGGQATFVSPVAGGPYTVADKNPYILAYAYQWCGDRSGRSTNSMAGAPAYFTRFILRYDAPDPASPAELLVMHQSYGACPGGWHNVYLAPLKLAHIDDEGTMRLQYWKGNDNLLGKLAPAALSEARVVASDGAIVKNITSPCNNFNGTVITGKAPAGDGSVVFYGSDGNPESIEMGVSADGILHVWICARAGAERVAVERIDRAMSLAATVEWRVLLRGSMAEVYVDGVLILPVPLRNTVSPGGLATWAAGVRAPNITVGLRGSWVASTGIQRHTMSLPALFPTGVAT
eukprot:COSAG02_NODE_367_length_23739_cov_16.775127_8_plen_566_part_00